MGMFSRNHEPAPDPEAHPSSENQPQASSEPQKTQAELLAEALSPFAATLKTISDKVDSVEQRFQARQPSHSEGQPAQPQYASVFEDEDAAIGQRVVAAVGPMYQQQLEMQADINREKVLGEFRAKGFGPTLEKFTERINSLLDVTPLVQPDGQGGHKAWRGDKAYIRNTINMVIGEAAAAAGLRFDGTKQSFFLEGANGGDGSTSSSSPSDGLTNEQRKLFSRYKVSPADAQKTIAKLKFFN
jgi:hypothetical protein